RVLEPVVTRAEAKRPDLDAQGFYDRQKLGIGHFLDRKELSKTTRLDIALAKVPGMAIRNAGMKAWAYTTRSTNLSKCAFCPIRPHEIVDSMDLKHGAILACYLDVYVNAVLVYEFGPNPPTPLFDLNTYDPSDIEAVET